MGVVAAYVFPHPPLIVPAVGQGAQARIERTVESCKEAARRIVLAAPDTVVVSSPHAPAYRDAFHATGAGGMAGSMTAFGAPHETLRFDCDAELLHEVFEGAASAGLNVIADARELSEMDHGTFIPLWFLNRAWKESGCGKPPRIVRIGISGMGLEAHRSLGALVAAKAETLGRRVVWVASGDLSHKLREDGPYGFDPAGPLFDEKACESFRTGRLDGLFSLDSRLCEDAAECGLRSFAMMAGALEKIGFESELLSHEDLGVGYAVACFEGPEACGNDRVLRLARWAVRRSVIDGCQASCPPWVGEGLVDRKAGVFVSLHKAGKLRGCIGTIVPARACLAEEILRNAYAATHEDPRFPPVAPCELGEIEVSVDVLGAPEPASCEELDAKRYGVIVTKGLRRGLLLPDLEGVETVEEQLAIAKRKAGIGETESDVLIERFEVVRHG